MIPLNKRIAKGKDTVKRQWGYFLLASETGSGKSFAYLLPVLQHLKETEAKLGETPQPELPAPRAIVLAPTHELSRQLARFAKSLIHHEKLRVVCASRANTESSLNVGQVKFEGEPAEGEEASRHQRQVDVLTSTPGRLLDLALGSSWNKANGGADMKDGMENNKAITVGEPRISLERVECVVVDEADILFGEQNQASEAFVIRN
jgi:ATP-dependent RNA helicase MRH4